MGLFLYIRGLFLLVTVRLIKIEVRASGGEKNDLV